MISLPAAVFSISLRKDIVILLLATLLLLAGNGLLETSVSYRTSLLSQSSLLTGIIMACYYSGFLVGSWYGPSLLKKFSHQAYLGVAAFFFTLAISLLGSVHLATAVALLQFFCGLCIASIYVTVESYINSRSCSNSRGRYFSYYMAVWYIGVGCGQLPLLFNSGFYSHFFYVAACLAVLAFVPWFFWKPVQAYRSKSQKLFESSAEINFVGLLSLDPKPYFVSLISGLMIGVLFGMGPAFGEQFFSNSYTTSKMILAFVIGALLMQLALTLAARYWESSRLLLMLSCVGVLAVISCVWVTRTATGTNNFINLLLPSLMLGASCLPVYSLAVALAQDKVQHSSPITASALMLLCNGLGSIIGPILAGYCMQHWGHHSFYVSLLLCHLLLMLCFLGVATRKKLSSLSIGSA
ncbi:MFS transporter [uncultured Pseudoteredinibacter sp.]|uniref:MFS transporter n=1 Tax=uncultured Pseudoteredinibacter sp. TaxID=1641701 RepID=UPI0026182554|nr:MFS transporter [uncultured Pseudoteredinibacter sp.]